MLYTHEDYDRRVYRQTCRYNLYTAASHAHGRAPNVEKRRENTCRICPKTAADFTGFYFHRKCVSSEYMFFSPPPRRKNEQVSVIIILPDIISSRGRQTCYYIVRTRYRTPKSAAIASFAGCRLVVSDPREDTVEGIRVGVVQVVWAYCLFFLIKPIEQQHAQAVLWCVESARLRSVRVRS